MRCVFWKGTQTFDHKGHTVTIEKREAFFYASFSGPLGESNIAGMSTRLEECERQACQWIDLLLVRENI